MCGGFGPHSFSSTEPMNFSIVFDKTGDSIPLLATNPDIVEYYVDTLNQQGLNSFLSMSNKITNLSSMVNLLNNTISECSELSQLIGYPIAGLTTDDSMDQQKINQLHARWVASQLDIFDIALKKQSIESEILDLIHHSFPDNIPTPLNGTVISVAGYSETYGKINTYLHQLEEVFSTIKFTVNTQQWVSFNNPFDPSRATNDIANFRLTFHHLGRTLYNKFTNFDVGDCDDENTYNELLGFVSFHLVPPQTIPLSAEYIAWCKHHNKIPSGDYLNLGNIVDLHNKLTEYRMLFFKNIQNEFSIQL